MEFGICLNTVIPVRRDPSHVSEMTTQVLFGELYRILGKENNWFRIQLIYDNYEGWIHHLQSQLIAENEFLRLADSETPVTIDLVQHITNETRLATIPIVMGSSLPGFKDQRFRVDQEVYFYEGSTSDSTSPGQGSAPNDILKARQQIIDNAMLYLDAPYMWGGRTPFGIDCSGFIQMVYKLNKIKLLRDAVQQSAQGEVISLLAEAEPGDIAFFDDEEGKITHSGLLIDRSSIIHCSGKVRIDSLDHQGIYNHELQNYTHKLRLIKRIA
ncbi:MAG: C40 family peptidase [Bacteroidota bacterium]